MKFRAKIEAGPDQKTSRGPGLARSQKDRARPGRQKIKNYIV